MASCRVCLIPCLKDPQRPVAHMIPGGYGERGWCRLESFCFYVMSLLMGKSHPELYSFALGSSIKSLDYVLLPDAMPSGGELYNEDDRQAVKAHEETLLATLHSAAVEVKSNM